MVHLPRAMLAAAVYLLAASGCTTWQHVSQDRDTLRSQIESGLAVSPGERVVITTESGQSFNLTVVAVQDGLIQGRDRSVPVDSVVALQKQQVDAARTAGVSLVALAGAILLTALLLQSVVFVP